MKFLQRLRNAKHRINTKTATTEAPCETSTHKLGKNFVRLYATVNIPTFVHPSPLPTYQGCSELNVLWKGFCFLPANLKFDVKKLITKERGGLERWKRDTDAEFIHRVLKAVPLGRKVVLFDKESEISFNLFGAT